jgi:hypothetical protein
VQLVVLCCGIDCIVVCYNINIVIASSCELDRFYCTVLSVVFMIPAVGGLPVCHLLKYNGCAMNVNVRDASYHKVIRFWNGLRHLNFLYFGT